MAPRALVGTTATALLVAVLLTAPATAAPPVERAKGCTVTGTSGPDVLVGTGGRDVLCGLGGKDDLRGRDSKKSHDVLNCGAGKADRATADPSDVVSSSCEKVTQKHAPVAVDDTVTTAEDAAVALPASGSGGPAANDTDA